MSANVCDFTFLKGVKIVDFTQFEAGPSSPADRVEWNNPGYAGIPGYEEYLKRQTAYVGVADAGLAARRATEPIGTPDKSASTAAASK